MDETAHSNEEAAIEIVSAIEQVSNGMLRKKKFDELVVDHLSVISKDPGLSNRHSWKPTGANLVEPPADFAEFSPTYRIWMIKVRNAILSHVNIFNVLFPNVYSI